ncbi:hypothetical protein ACFQ09_08140 [Massilia norwichensis]|jgi:hypothetical protein|uniref:N-acyl-L-homoserine lactone synthetase n=1 Tax=Massilia norwichensis TaxID=1442366 RepID=A0ABT2AD50_9BURK|nr:hypothetical protein [Massilia norwichensis]MCS0591705.1 hypothetical protein [Massilia norwichensis]
MDMRQPAIPVSINAKQEMPVERLPFTVRRVDTEEALWKAVRIRQSAYARHVPDFARTLALPEACDYANDTIVLLAESKLDGSALGTARIQTNVHGPLHVEESIELPDWLQGRRLAEVTRLGVSEGRIGHVVKVALMKAFFQFWEQSGTEFAIATGRAPIDRQYEQLMFSDVFEPGQMIPLSHVGNIPHRVMAFEIATAEARWTAAKHPLLKFVRQTSHPDIQVGELRTRHTLRAAMPQMAPIASPIRQFAVA